MSDLAPSCAHFHPEMTAQALAEVINALRNSNFRPPRHSAYAEKRYVTQRALELAGHGYSRYLQSKHAAWCAYIHKVSSGNIRDGDLDIHQRLAIQERFEMSFEVFEKLEAKVQQAIDTITLLQMEIEELKETNNNLSQQVQHSQSNHEELVRENNSLKEQQHVWQDRLHALLGKMEEV